MHLYIACLPLRRYPKFSHFTENPYIATPSLNLSKLTAIHNCLCLYHFTYILQDVSLLLFQINLPNTNSELIYLFVLTLIIPKLEPD